jgi:DNA-binding transcriptional regulator GbsR (MarR family)
LAKKLGLSRLNIRAVVKSLERREIADLYFKEFGRQKMTIYVAKRFMNMTSKNQMKLKKKIEISNKSHTKKDHRKISPKKSDILTDRQIGRVECILNLVNECVVVEDLAKIYR